MGLFDRIKNFGRGLEQQNTTTLGLEREKPKSQQESSRDSSLDQGYNRILRTESLRGAGSETDLGPEMGRAIHEAVEHRIGQGAEAVAGSNVHKLGKKQNGNYYVTLNLGPDAARATDEWAVQQAEASQTAMSEAGVDATRTASIYGLEDETKAQYGVPVLAGRIARAWHKFRQRGDTARAKDFERLSRATMEAEKVGLEDKYIVRDGPQTFTTGARLETFLKEADRLKLNVEKMPDIQTVSEEQFAEHVRRREKARSMGRAKEYIKASEQMVGKDAERVWRNLEEKYLIRDGAVTYTTTKNLNLLSKEAERLHVGGLEMPGLQIITETDFAKYKGQKKEYAAWQTQVETVRSELQTATGQRLVELLHEAADLGVPMGKIDIQFGTPREERTMAQAA